jgi:DNA-binding NarL/FixJ family response regulator
MQFSKLSNQKRIRVLLADDHTVLRQGLAHLLSQEPDFEIVGEAADGQRAVNMAVRLRPDIVLMDLGMPGMSGIEATETIVRKLPEIRVIGLSMSDESERADAMLEAGASLYLNKSGPVHNLISAIRSCMKMKVARCKNKVRRLPPP